MRTTISLSNNTVISGSGLAIYITINNNMYKFLINHLNKIYADIWSY